MKRKYVMILLLAASLTMVGCGSTNTNSNNNTASTTSTSNITVSDDGIVHADDAENYRTDITGDFTITTEVENGYTVENNVYTITEAGEYTLSGVLSEGQIVIDAADDAEVTLILNGVSITCSTGSPIYAANADSVKIKSEDDTFNEIIDSREAKVDDDSSDSSSDTEDSDTYDTTTGNGAITAKVDLSLTGKGALVVSSTYNNGIHTSKDLTVKNVTLKVTARNNALKGKDSVTVESGELILIAQGGDGIHTSDSDLSESGTQRGTVSIQGGNIDIYAACDGIDAAYDATVASDGNLNIYTDTCSEYTDDSAISDDDDEDTTTTDSRMGFGMDSGNTAKSDHSAKGIKADNSITVDSGTIYIFSNDDAIHANNDETLENGETATGDVTINGGTLTLSAADDGIHADNIATISGGTITVTTAYEGIEGNQITINDGTIDVYATDDGLNASSGNATPLITVAGGSLSVETPSGDTDAIDSNGNYVQTGGSVLVMGGASTGSMAGSIDVDGTIQVTGGTVVALGGICETPTDSVNAYATSDISTSAGTYEITDGDGNVITSFTIENSFQGFWVASDQLAEGSTYTLSQDGTQVTQWTQEAGTMGATTSSMGGMGGGNMGGGNMGGTDPNSSDSSSDGTTPTAPSGSTDGSAPTAPGNGTAPSGGPGMGGGGMGDPNSSSSSTTTQ